MSHTDLQAYKIKSNIFLWLTSKRNLKKLTSFLRDCSFYLILGKAWLFL